MPRLPRLKPVLHKICIRLLVPDARAAGRSMCGNAGPLYSCWVTDACDPRVVPVLVDLADFVHVGFLEVDLDVVQLVAVVAVGDGCELGVTGGAELTVKFPWVPAAARVPTLLRGC